jgi:hypothetical protein
MYSNKRFYVALSYWGLIFSTPLYILFGALVSENLMNLLDVKGIKVEESFVYTFVLIIDWV